MDDDPGEADNISNPMLKIGRAKLYMSNRPKT